MVIRHKGMKYLVENVEIGGQWSGVSGQFSIIRGGLVHSVLSC